MSARLWCWKWCLGIIIYSLACQPVLAVKPSSSKKNEMVAKRYIKTYVDSEKEEEWEVAMPGRTPIEGGEAEIITTIRRSSEPDEVRRYSLHFPGGVSSRAGRDFASGNLVLTTTQSGSGLSEQGAESTSGDRIISHHYCLHTRSFSHPFWGGVLLGAPMLDSGRVPYFSGRQTSANNDGTLSHAVSYGNEIRQQQLLLRLRVAANGQLEILRIEAIGLWTLEAAPDNSMEVVSLESSNQVLPGRSADEDPLIQDDNETIELGRCCGCCGPKVAKE